MIKQQLFALSLGFAGLILATQHVFAQSPANCGPRDRVVAELAERYGETRHGLGLLGSSSVMELFASDQTGTWTITVTSGTGVTCLVAAGQNYETLADALPVPGKGA